jgi:hypothetical protein
MKHQFVEPVVLSPRDVKLDVPFMRELLVSWGFLIDQTITSQPSSTILSVASSNTGESRKTR